MSLGNENDTDKRRAKTEAALPSSSNILNEDNPTEKDKESEKDKVSSKNNLRVVNNSNIVSRHQREESKNVLYSALEKGSNNGQSNSIKTQKGNNDTQQFDKCKIEKESNSNKENNDVLSNGYCMDCLQEIPLRGKHCKECGKCIATFDHHCKWVGNCIGEQNKYIFHIFLFWHSGLMLMGISYVKNIIIYNNKKNLGHFQKEIHLSNYFKDNWLIYLNTLFCLLLFCFVLSILVFQIQILVVNQTTWENYSWHKIPYMRALSGTIKSPFDLKFCQNIKVVYNRKSFLEKGNNGETSLNHNNKSQINVNPLLNWKKICNIQ